ncbi:MAG: hypothetical protein WBD86_02650 [Microgenomates group bacterium]
MKVILLHGNHTLDSYKRLQKFITVAKKRGWQIARITDNNKLTLPEKLTGKSLFGGEELFVIESLRKLKNRELVWLKKNAKRLKGNLIICYKGTIPNSLLKLLPRPNKIEEFKLPKLIFKFLESFYPGNAKNCLKLLHEVVKTEPPEFVFSLLGKQLRDTCWAIVDKDSLPYPDWRTSKLIKQAKRFPESKLKKIIGGLAKADIKAKTSKANIIDSLDFIIASELE